MTKIYKVKQKPKKHTKDKKVGFKINKCEMYTCVRMLLRLGRWFGIFPVEGLDSHGISRLRFNIKSFYGVYIFLSFIGQLSMTLITFWGLVDNDFSLNMFSHFFFYLTSSLSMILKIILARNWPRLMRSVAEVEEKVTVSLSKTTYKNIFRMQALFLLSNVVENCLCYIYVLNFAMKCLQEFNFSFPVAYMVFTLKLNFLVDATSLDLLNFCAGVIFEFTFFQASFMWKLVDIFVMTEAMYLSGYFKALNKVIESQKNDVSTDWAELREQYSYLVILVKKIDIQLSSFVLMFFISNLFFTVLQLFNTLRAQTYDFGICDPLGALDAITGAIHDSYYIFSFICLITRTLGISVLIANVNAYASEPIWALGEVHATKYNYEIERFYRQITYTTVGVSGIFFYVTREMILKLLGTLITYELVLLQFYTGEDVYKNYTASNNSSLSDISRKRITFNY